MSQGRVIVSGTIAVVVASALLYAGLADAAASGRVIGMTSGGGNKGNGVVVVSPGLGSSPKSEVMTITAPIGNVQCSKDGSPIDCPGGSATLVAKVSHGSESCSSFTTRASIWRGSGKVTWASSTGKGVSITLKNYALTFSPGVLYASEKGTANGDGVQNGNETGLDAFSTPTGFSCTTPGSVLKGLSLIGVLKVTS